LPRDRIASESELSTGIGSEAFSLLGIKENTRSTSRDYLKAPFCFSSFGSLEHSSKVVSIPAVELLSPHTIVSSELETIIDMTCFRASGENLERKFVGAFERVLIYGFI